MYLSKSLLSVALIGCLVGCGGGGSSKSTPVASSAPSSAKVSSSSSSSSLVASSSSSSVSGLAFCANLTSDADNDGIGSENNQACQMRSGFDITHDMGTGWNLGNTMDAMGNTANPLNDETYWGNPKTTKANMDTLKSAGFNTLRLPVSWDDHFSGTEYTIDNAWMDRVEEIAKYALDNEMYVIINIHHNNGWEAPTVANEANSKDHLVKLWKQIAERFKAYDHHVIFETMNEPRVSGGADEWTGKQEYYTVLNHLNAATLSAIRETGGNNAKRLVMLPGYAASSGSVPQNAIVLPEDKMIAVSVHAYEPFTSAFDQSGTDKFTDTKSLDDLFLRLNNKFILKGIPVVLGEWASTNKNNLAERVKHAEYYVKAATKYGIPTIWWDNGNFSIPVIPYVSGAPSDIMGLLDRDTNKWRFPTIVDAIMRGAK